MFILQDTKTGCIFRENPAKILQDNRLKFFIQKFEVLI